jgi:hypothetical protein
MADSGYDASVSNFQARIESYQLNKDERERIETELDRLTRAFRAAQSANAKLYDLAKALIWKSKSMPSGSCAAAARISRATIADHVDKLWLLLNSAYLGADALDANRKRGAIQAFMAQVIDGLDHLWKDQHPGPANEEDKKMKDEEAEGA